MWKPQPFFEVPQPGWSTFGKPAAPIAETLPIFHNDVEKKKAFGIALAKQTTKDQNAAFKAALEVFEDQTGPSLWAASHWMNDPVVIAARDLYLKAVKAEEKLLDKVELAAKLLHWAEEKVSRGGQDYYVNDLKDRTATLKLYAEIAGYTGKINIDASTNNNFHNEMKLTLVRAPEIKEQKTIEHEEIIDEEMLPSPVRIKLVG